MCTARLLTIPRHALMGVCLPGGVPTQGVYLPRGYLPGGCTCPEGVNRMTDRSKNITLPQTSFAGGNKQKWHQYQNNDFGTLDLIKKQFINMTLCYPI